jgi:hypothetical protein
MKCTCCKKEWKKWNPTKALGHCIGSPDIQQCKKMPVKWVKIIRKMSEASNAKEAAKVAASAKVETEVDAKQDLAMKLPSAAPRPKGRRSTTKTPPLMDQQQAPLWS